jgi:hypothetical protein
VVALFASISALACRSAEGSPPAHSAQSIAQSTDAGTAPRAELAPATSPAEESSNMLARHPIFDVRLDIENCAHDVYVNGALVTRSLEIMPTHIEYQVNHFMRSGRNEIEVQMFDAEEEPNECDVQLALRWKGASAPADVKPVTLATLVYDSKTTTADVPARGSSPSGSYDATTGLPAPRGEIKVGDPSLVRLTGEVSHVQVLKRSIDIPVGFPEWAFLRSDKLALEWEFANAEQEERAYQDLLARYNELHALLEKGDAEGFADACEERSREIDLAYFKTPGETRKALLAQLKKAMSDPDLELADLYKKPGKHWGYAVGSQGTLVLLTQGTRASTIFRYQLKDGNPFSLVFPVMFRKQNGKFIVTR